MAVFVFKNKLTGVVTAVRAQNIEAAALRLYEHITRRTEDSAYSEACTAVVLKTHDVLAYDAEVLQ